ncbi:Peptidyl-prolyl cis-trans isomerase cyp8 [Apophysomyces ossiformis]|uniref:Peptidyl-prolyl cis-trans isomerase cyp8 n=1 Tax=Apophysomyces ossiformis TaxID=679940 RepID=A0A8H7BXK1_9FUNG|nr:Peptidyl-prolyl cis-trans isomerase cyp8 [Apophysomyces ossiformis]
MGKWTDKLYITHSEWSGEVGQHSASSGTLGRKKGDGFKRLPFYCCSLSLQPFEFPVCTPEGIVFDLTHIVPYLKKYGTNPVTGEKLETKNLIKLNFYKNDKDEYYCPVTYKVFSDHTVIAAIKTTGNVFAYDTIERLNIKAKHWKDLLTDEPFTKKDIIMIQDPHNLENRNMSRFHYLKNDLKVVDEVEERERRKPINNINVKGTTGRVLAELQKKEEEGNGESSTSATGLTKSTPIPTSFHQKKAAQAYNAAHFSTGRVAEGFTSTVAAPVTLNERALIDEDEFMYKHIRSKAYARIVTNLGNLNIELYCDKTPRTCYNFVMLAKKGYYNNVIFHRSIKNFMIQGGDPTGTGRGGESYWGKEFPDEIRQSLSHDDRGILSMANHGKNTNSSQFFITYRPCTQLDSKHTIFGRVVGGLDVLNKMEMVPTDEGDRPERTIKMKEVLVFVDPYEEYKRRLKKRLEHEANADLEAEEERKRKEKQNSMGWFGPNVNKIQGKASGSGGVGKYLQQATAQKRAKPDTSEIEDIPSESPKRPKIKQQSYGNFDNF